MNKLEAFVYQRVKNNYLLKDAVRNVYQAFYDLLPNYESRFQHAPIVLEDSSKRLHSTLVYLLLSKIS